MIYIATFENNRNLRSIIVVYDFTNFANLIMHSMVGVVDDNFIPDIKRLSVFVK